MKYQVVRDFLDKTDNNYLYKVGDIYPREGVKVTKTRTKELLTTNNVTGDIYIKEIPELKVKEVQANDRSRETRNIETNG
jgi:hypothetical protein